MFGALIIPLEFQIVGVQKNFGIHMDQKSYLVVVFVVLHFNCGYEQRNKRCFVIDGPLLAALVFASVVEIDLLFNGGFLVEERVFIVVIVIQ